MTRKPNTKITPELCKLVRFLASPDVDLPKSAISQRTGLSPVSVWEILKGNRK
jgi:hypothetical protein